MPVIYNGKRPTDLAYVEADWSPTPVTRYQRICAAKLAGLIPPYGPVAVAISLNEQPRKIPGNNATGMMPWAEEFPWGWSVEKWAKIQPDGYFVWKEGTSTKTGVFFHFARLADSLKLCADTCRNRNIVDGDSYCRKWVGQAKPNESTSRSFGVLLAGVQREWAEVEASLCGPIE